MTTAAESRPIKQRKPKVCKTCREPFQPMSSTHVCCSIRCAVDLAKRKREQKERKELAAAKARIKPRSQWLKEAQAAVNSYVRARDAGKPCISCGAMPDQKYGGTMDCGHYRSTGAAPHLRFDTERNMACQCVRCNRHLSGNAVAFRMGLVARIGLAAVEALEADQTLRKFSIDDLKQIKAEYVAKRKAIEKERETSFGE